MIENFLEQIRKNKFFVNSGPQDWADRFTTFATILLSMLAGIVALKFLMTSSMTCLPLEAPKIKTFPEFSENFVWSHGFIPANCLNKNNENGPNNFNDWKQLYNQYGIFHYLWTPFILLLPLALLGWCRTWWETRFESTQYSNLNDLITDLNAGKITSSKIDELSKRFKIVTQIQHSMIFKYFSKLFGKKTYQYGNHLSGWFIAHKLLIVTASIISSFILWLIFGINPSHITTLPNLEYYENSDIQSFPLIAVGYVRNLRLPGTTNSYLIHCIMAGNLIFSKIFIVSQLLLLFVALINLIWAIKWIIYLLKPQYWLKRSLKGCTLYDELGDSRINDMLQDFTDRFLRTDGILTLILMKRSGLASARAGKLLLWNLWEQYIGEVIPKETTVISNTENQ